MKAQITVSDDSFEDGITVDFEFNLIGGTEIEIITATVVHDFNGVLDEGDDFEYTGEMIDSYKDKFYDAWEDGMNGVRNDYLVNQLD